jgi:hypothetical protein
MSESHDSPATAATSQSQRPGQDPPVPGAVGGETAESPRQSTTAAGAGGQAGQSGRPASRPIWDKQKQELRFEGRLCKRFSQAADTQVVILDAFEEEGWPERIYDPLPPGEGRKGKMDPKKRLGEAVRRLNDCSHLRFSRQEKGEAVGWKAAPAKTDRKTARKSLSRRLGELVNENERLSVVVAHQSVCIQKVVGVLVRQLLRARTQPRLCESWPRELGAPFPEWANEWFWELSGSQRWAEWAWAAGRLPWVECAGLVV